MECRVHKLVADVALRAEGRVLLVRYRDTSKYDRQTGWFLPDDFLEHGEHPDAAAARIVREQAGVEPPELRLAEIESFADGAWHLVFHYRGDLDSIPALEPGENVAASEWFALDALPDPAEVGHRGWALETVAKVFAES
jgi:ADP-ribose pyrophosphatase YjhB (NUDIX family)